MPKRSRSDDYEERALVDPEKAQPDDFDRYKFPGKFEGEANIAVRLYAMGPDTELGDVEGFGWYGFFRDVDTADGIMSFIVHEDSQGFYSIESEGTLDEVENEWSTIEDEYEEFEEGEG